MVYGSPNGPVCYVLVIHSKHFWQFTNTVVLETVELIPEATKLSFRHNHQADGPPPIVEIRFCNILSNFLFFLNLHVFQTDRLFWGFAFFIHSLFTFFILTY
jgi:hypothetical protein